MFHKENSSTSSSKGKKAKDVPLRKSDRRALRERVTQVLVLTDDAADSEAVLDEIFLQGTLVSRQIQLPDHVKATLYIRSPSSPQNDGSSSAPCSCWPYTVSAQCVWMQLDSKSKWQAADGTAILVDVPTLPLLAVLSPLSSQPEQQLQQTVATRIPTVTVPPHVSKYLCRGAHLMRAGMRQWLVPSNDSSKQQQRQQQGPKVIAVQVQGHPQPFAVGILADDLDWKDAPNNNKMGVGMTGVGVTIVTCYGDDLWKQQVPTTTAAAVTMKANDNGSRSQYDDGDYGNAGFCQGKYVLPIVHSGENDDGAPESGSENNENDESNKDDISRVSTEGANDIMSADTSTIPAVVEDDASPSQVSDNDTTGGATASEQLQEEEEEERASTPEQVLHAAVCRALVQINPKKQLPMLVSTFYSQHVLPNRPPNTTIELKRTKYKKLGPYLAEQVEAGLLMVRADSKTNNPIAILTDYNKHHPDLQEYAAQEEVAASSSNSTDQRLVMTNLYCLPGHFVSLLQLDPAVVKAENATSPERKGTGMLTAKEMRSILEDYIDREGLVDSLQRQMVLLDGPLSDALYGKKKKADPQKATAIPNRLSRKDIVELWTNKMEGAYAIVQLPGNHIVKLGRGKPPSVTIEVSMRQSRKFVTHVRGLEHFGLDAAAVCKDVSQRFACSGSVEENPTNRAALPSRHVELVFQGNLADELEALLMGDESLSSHGGVRRSPYCLPKNSIEFVLHKGVPPRKKRAATKKRK